MSKYCEIECVSDKPYLLFNKRTHQGNCNENKR